MLYPTTQNYPTKCSRLPDLKEFLKGETGASVYENVRVRYVKGKSTVLRVFDNGEEVKTQTLSTLRTMEQMHKALLSSGFTRKSKEQLDSDRHKERLLRLQREYSMFHRKEYVRQQEMHVNWFRNDVMQLEGVTYITNNGDVQDYLIANYDKINGKIAIKAQDRLRQAIQYLQAQYEN